MKKNNEEELKEECCCNHECECDKQCDCGNECHCDDDCECECGCCDADLPPLEEKLVLVGIKGDKLTEEAIKYLDKENVDFTFLDLKDNKTEEILKLGEKTKVPTLLLVQTVVAGIASGLDEIKEAIEG